MYLCAVALVFLIPEDETIYNEFQRRGIYADIDFPVDCRSIIMEYLDVIGRSNFLLYHSPYSLLAAVSRYVVLHHGSVSRPPHHYQAFRESFLHFKRNPCYAISMTSAHHSIWPSFPHEGIREDDVRTLQQGEKKLYDLLERDLSFLSQVMNRDDSCCSSCHAKLYGQFRYPVALDRLQSIISLLQWMVTQLIEADVQDDMMKLDTTPANSYSNTTIKLARFIRCPF
jgi:hypothetical protein